MDAFIARKAGAASERFKKNIGRINREKKNYSTVSSLFVCLSVWFEMLISFLLSQFHQFLKFNSGRIYLCSMLLQLFLCVVDSFGWHWVTDKNSLEMV